MSLSGGMRKLLLFPALLLPACSSTPSPATPEIPPSWIESHVRFLSDDLLEGRGVATRGDEIARLYIRTQFQAAGLQPAGTDGTWEQPVPILGLTEGEKQDLVAFMLALTDERVRYSRAPFDHPSLNLPDGVPLPAVGAGGRAQPIRRFLDADPFQR